MEPSSGNPTRKEAAKSRSQFYNPTTGHYIKKDPATGRFLEVKSDGKFKGVRVEKPVAKANPNVSKEQASRAENAVISVLNKRKQ